MPATPPLPLNDIRRCACDPNFVAEMERLYADLDAEIAARSPVCTNRGACCRFDEFGHSLFVTTAELAFLVAAQQGSVVAACGPGCPYQQDGLCTARAGRPAGCRIFYCDPQAQDWQGPCTERTLARIRAIHERFELPYVYVEWRAALTQLSTGLTTSARCP